MVLESLIFFGFKSNGREARRNLSKIQIRLGPVILCRIILS
jgi:hypothetical protein